MYAIIDESGGQRKVEKDQVIDIDLHEAGQARPGTVITFDKVLVVGDVGGTAKVGQPYVKGASVKGEVIDPMALGEKVFIHKYREKKTWQKKTGHRQRYTTVRITDINA